MQFKSFTTSEASFTQQGKKQLPVALGSSVRHFLLTFLKLGLLECLETHGGYRYRLSAKANAQPYFERLQEAAAAMKP